MGNGPLDLIKELGQLAISLGNNLFPVAPDEASEIALRESMFRIELSLRYFSAVTSCSVTPELEARVGRMLDTQEQWTDWCRRFFPGVL